MHTQTLSQVENTNQSSLRYSKSINTKPKKAKGSNPDLQAIYEGILKNHRSNPNALRALYDINGNPRKPSKNRMTSIADNKENNTSALRALYDINGNPRKPSKNRMTSIADNKENNTSALRALYDINGNPRKPSKNRMTSIADEHCPCDTCESAYLCADIKMACVDFNRYLSDGKFHNKDRRLSREMYIKIYPTDPLSRAVQM